MTFFFLSSSLFSSFICTICPYFNGGRFYHSGKGQKLVAGRREVGINNWDPRGMTSTAVLLEEIKNVSAGEVRSLGSL